MAMDGCCHIPTTEKPMKFRLRFPIHRLEYWAGRYDHASDELVEYGVAPVAKARGFLTKEEFAEFCRWKSPRSISRCLENAESVVQEATRIALSAKTDPAKIGVLLALNGVSWPTASVILHFCDKAPYPILDFRALWSLGFRKPPTYRYSFWQDYTKFVRNLAKSSRLTMRMVDRALWQYSKERQRT